MTTQKIKRYLEKHKIYLREIESSGAIVRFHAVVVIPAIAEYDYIKRLLISLSENDADSLSRTLILFVVNHTINSSEEVKSENLQTIKYLKWIMNEGAFKINLALIDCASGDKMLDAKTGGVGLARKIGMDSSLKYLDNNGLLICLDADCSVSKNYLKNIFHFFEANNLSAAVVRYEHLLANSSTTEAIICYEIFLRYYLLGLKFAQSPFAHHTIGSTMICRAECYVSIGGMNKRKAAEDFYFIEKIAKDFEIGYIDNAIVYPSSRGSWRVPFGTGQRVNRFLSHRQDEYLLYSSESFVALKKWIALLNGWDGKNPNVLFEQAGNISVDLNIFLSQNNFVDDWKKIYLNSRSTDQLTKQKKYWFDGFKTLKLIHHLRDNSFPAIAMFTALNELFELLNIQIEFAWHSKEIPPLEIQKKYLFILRKLT